MFNLDIINTEEVITVNEIAMQKDSILIKAPTFDGFIKARYTPRKIQGRCSIENMDRSITFIAVLWWYR